MWKQYVMSIMAGGIAGVGVSYGWWLLVLIGLIGWLGTLDRCCSWWQRFNVGFLFTFAKLLVVLSWWFATYPMDWLVPLPTGFSIALITLYWLAAALVIGLGAALVSSLHRTYRYVWLSTLTFASLFTFGESVGAFLFSLGSYGAGGTVQSYFSFGYVGYGWGSNEYMLRYASWGGVYALSFITYVLAYVLHRGWRHNPYQYSFILLGVLVLPATIAITHEPQQTTVTTIDTHFTTALAGQSDGYQTRTTALQTAVMTAIENGARTIVLPEDARFIARSFTSPEVAQRWWQSQFGLNTAAQLYDSGRTTNAAGEIVLRGYVLHTGGTQPALFDKSYLVPQGEYLPAFAEWGLTWFAPAVVSEKIRDHLAYRPSQLTQYPATSRLAGYLFCFEAVNPLGARQALARQSSNYLVHPVSHAWFSRSSHALRQQLTTMLKVQAIWQQIPIVVAGNEFAGFVVLPDGSIEQGTVTQHDQYWSIKQYHF